MPADLYSKLKKLIYDFEPTAETLLNGNEDVYPYGQTHLCPNLAGFRDLWIMPEHKTWLLQKLGWPENVEATVDISLHIDKEGFWQEPHRDLKPTQSPYGYGTLQIYFGDSDKADTGAWVLDDDLNKVEQIPFDENTAWCFLASDISWHSVDKITRPIDRRSIMINVRGPKKDNKFARLPAVSGNTGFLEIQHYKNFSDHSRIDFCITTYCQSKCPTCPRTNEATLDLESFISLQHMPFAVWENVVDGIDWSNKIIQFCGEHGDPMMHPDIEKFILSGCSRAWSVEVNTNGGIRNKKWYHDIWEKVEDCDYGELAFTFAIDGLTQETNEKYRINVDFERAWENFNVCANKYPRLTKWDYLIFEHNWHELEDVIRIAKELEVNLVCKVNRGEYGLLRSAEGKQHVQRVLGVDVDADGTDHII